MKHILLSSLFLLFAAGAWANGNGPVHNTTKDLYYQTIQEAVTAATDGDVIEVAEGIYTVTSTIHITTDNLTLRNKDDDDVVIQPCSDLVCPQPPDEPFEPELGFSGLIHIKNANGVTLEGFKIKGPIDIEGEPDFFSFQFGVFVDNSNSTKINNNIITGFFAGLVIEFGESQELKGNTVADNFYGIAVFCSSDVSINENNIYNNVVLDLLYELSGDIDATCNWWGTTDLIEIENQIESFGNEGQSGPTQSCEEGEATWFPFWAAKNGPCLQQLFKLQIETKRQIEQ